jgi:HEAT repeat protein
MEDGLTKRFAAIALLVGVSTIVGCAQGSSMAQWNPFYKPQDVFDPAQYGPTIDDRLQEIRSLADRAPRMDPAEREQVAGQLGQRLQSEASPITKLELIHALGKFETPTADTALRMALADPDPQLRRAAVEAWGARRSEQAIQALNKTLSSDTDLDVRIAAAKALGNFKDRAAIEALGVALDDPDPALQYRAIQSLRLATGRDYGGDVAAWRQVVQGGEPTNFNRPSYAQRWLSWF